MADKERPVATFAPSYRSIKLYRGGRIEYQKKSGSIIGATARVDSSTSKGRFRDTRRVVLRIDGPRVAIAAQLPANAFQQQRSAREFAAAVNEMATRVAMSAGSRLARALTGGSVYTDDRAPVEWLTDLSILRYATGSR